MTCPPLHIPNKEWSGDRRELENYVAIERWALCSSECTCYVKHMETSYGGQDIDPQAADSGYRADPVQVTFSTINECGTIPDSEAMLVLHVNWFWSNSSLWPDGPTLDNSPANPNVPTALFVGVYGEGDSPSGGSFQPIARHTALALGGQWAYVNGDVDDGGSISVPLNLYPAGQDFTVWVAQNSNQTMSIQMRADLYTVCACSCVL